MNEILGTVVEGKRVGHTLGFPTANVMPDAGQPLPENGVYIGELRLAGGRVWRRCVVNQGMQPTLPSGRMTIEAYILDFDRDIYGKRVRLRFLKLLRREKKFASLDALVAQIRADERMAREYPAHGTRRSPIKNSRTGSRR